jgi:hypothetical protein
MRGAVDTFFRGPVSVLSSLPHRTGPAAEGMHRLPPNPDNQTITTARIIGGGAYLGPMIPHRDPPSTNPDEGWRSHVERRSAQFPRRRRRRRDRRPPPDPDPAASSSSSSSSSSPSSGARTAVAVGVGVGRHSPRDTPRSRQRSPPGTPPRGTSSARGRRRRAGVGGWPSSAAAAAGAGAEGAEGAPPAVGDGGAKSPTTPPSTPPSATPSAPDAERATMSRPRRGRNAPTIIIYGR